MRSGRSRPRWTGAVRPLRLGGGLALVGLLAAALVPVVQLDAPLSTVILDREGRLLGATIADDGQWRFGVADTVPPKFVAAITCFEDRRFFHHPGVDPLALVRALWLNVREGRVVSGGSTLTMQVVRLARHGKPRTYREKVVEVVLALRLSLALSKEQVLALYAAYAPFGGNTVGLAMVDLDNDILAFAVRPLGGSAPLGGAARNRPSTIWKGFSPGSGEALRHPGK